MLDEHTLESAFSTDELKAFWRPMLSSQADAPLLDATFIERTCAARPIPLPLPLPPPLPQVRYGGAYSFTSMGSWR